MANCYLPDGIKCGHCELPLVGNECLEPYWDAAKGIVLCYPCRVVEYRKGCAKRGVHRVSRSLDVGTCVDVSCLCGAKKHVHGHMTTLEFLSFTWPVVAVAQ